MKLGIELTVVLLFALSATTAVITRRMRVPYSIGLVVVGLIFGSTSVFRGVHLTRELLYTALLPGLLFEASFHLEARRLFESKWVVLGLALPGVIATVFLSAGVLLLVKIVPFAKLGSYVLLMTLLVSTDPIAVIATFKQLGAPKRLAVMMEGESLINDGVSVVLVGIVLQHLVGTPASVSSISLEFVRVVGIGLILGLSVGLIVSIVLRQLDDPMVEMTLTTVAAWGAFAVAEKWHASGVIATVAAGLVCGNYGATKGMGPSTRLAIVSFWEYIAFSFNSVVFLLIGIEVTLADVLFHWKIVLLTWAALMVARFLVTALAWLFLRRSREKFRWNWTLLLTWGGLRGGLSMVLALALPADVPHRELWITVTYGVVILSILGQGLTLSRLLRVLGLSKNETNTAYEIARTRLISARAGQRAVAQLGDVEGLPMGVLEQLRTAANRGVDEAETQLRESEADAPSVRNERHQRAVRQILVARKDAVLQAARRGVVDPSVAEQVVTELDVELSETNSSFAAEHETTGDVGQ